MPRQWTSAPAVDKSAATGGYETVVYESGFGNTFETEAIPGALPDGQNNPQVGSYGLYAEQISGTAFTMPRRDNQRTWMYRIRPSVTHLPFQEHAAARSDGLRGDFEAAQVTPNQLRWQPFKGRANTDFVSGLRTVCGAGSPGLKDGFSIHLYSFDTPMHNCCFQNSDGDFLLVPQTGTLRIRTELGWLEAKPGEIAVVQRGFRFRVETYGSAFASGYILEVFNSHFCLPELGPIGANCLANPRDFLYPVASCEERECEYHVLNKFQGRLFEAIQGWSPFNVAAWHGNYAPFKYDLSRFCPVNTVAFDHADPSIFTVLTCPSSIPGTAIADFVIFPPRWNVAEHTFRPPYFHRNSMSEFMGLIRGQYDGKAAGFAPGGASLHMCMTPHGPDTHTFEAASSADLQPTKPSEDTLAFMFEVNYIPRVFPWALESAETDYYRCWEGLKSHLKLPQMLVDRLE